MTDPIADMLIRIKNAQAVSHETVDIPYSNLKHRLADILLKNNFIKSIEKKESKKGKIIRIILGYDNKNPVIKELRRISKPGRRVYLPAKKIRSPRSGRGLTILSTPKGLMVDKEARKQRLGGEIICEVY